MRPLLIAALLPLAGALASRPALAQPRPFSCVGAERIATDSFGIDFRQASSTPDPAATAQIAAAAALARANPERNLCVLGHASRDGGQTANTRLSARRARAVSEALVQHGVARERIRAEARGAGFGPRAPTPAMRSVTVVVLPSAGAAAVPRPGVPGGVPGGGTGAAAGTGGAPASGAPAATQPAATPPVVPPGSSPGLPAVAAPPVVAPAAPPAAASPPDGGRTAGQAGTAAGAPD
ncbi:OmpA family protein [Roseomonas sp. NAR14]|uniref:OmpA family protein n=1 Tax=Roseomonas acroporae TaxID=2937791 RepID=A0A9X1Y2W6_9PROT|nr:OmpA family protein [Roseomonas acroporae]MCK8783169.1 OmpA family protein [Roseomonas acroporae]